MRLHVHRRDAIESAEFFRRHGLDLDIEQVGHAQVLGPCDALQGADDRGGPRPAQHVAKRETRGQRVGVRLVVKQDQHAVCISEEALVLLHPGAGQRTAKFGRERRGEQLRQVQMGDLREDRPELVHALAVRGRPDVEQIEQSCRRHREWC